MYKSILEPAKKTSFFFNFFLKLKLKNPNNAIVYFLVKIRLKNFENDCLKIYSIDFTILLEPFQNGPFKINLLNLQLCNLISQTLF